MKDTSLDYLFIKMTLFSMRKRGIFIKKDFCPERCLKRRIT